ncbi:MAG: hypothetical protein DRP09_15015 [Candidatus Thorarchaeota archaeon]|nr:MAG: hypothetical protein DRP09_15015 [Candidatus Thorarchaeota archaeon]
MREYLFQIGLKGLRPMNVSPINSGYLDLALNVLPLEGTLEAITGSDLVGPLSNYSWPFPQVTRLDGEIYLLGHNSVSLLNSDYSISTILSDIPSKGYPWAVAELGKGAILSNFYSIVTKEGKNFTVNSDDNKPVARALCNYKGQILAGNVYAYGEYRPSYVMWAKVGSLDFNLDSPSAGYIYLEDIGEILAMHSLINAVVVFGTLGVTMLVPATAPAMFGSQSLGSLPGIAGQLAYSGTPAVCYYLGVDGNVWEVGLGKSKVVAYIGKATNSACLYLDLPREVLRIGF